MNESVSVQALAPAALPLRRNWRFQVFWSGAVASLLGLKMAGLAYPLLILGLTGFPATAGAFGAPHHPMMARHRALSVQQIGAQVG
ncbi:hypothetical protein BFF78_01565 [Streptomyces fodineus]|uniref:MFS transporter n=1 Tax=Streptomyces fodineus TaxID=1904616 RepID=A0A1D7Y2X7_9ACTN|nr:hypothetical protein [Streptomyces fodineus]AOR29941.1 hypothetical protein BFF78_01565 [Streptomyces fodineus]